MRPTRLALMLAASAGVGSASLLCARPPLPATRARAPSMAAEAPPTPKKELPNPVNCARGVCVVADPVESPELCYVDEESDALCVPPRPRRARPVGDGRTREGVADSGV